MAQYILVDTIQLWCFTHAAKHLKVGLAVKSLFYLCREVRYLLHRDKRIVAVVGCVGHRVARCWRNGCCGNGYADSPSWGAYVRGRLLLLLLLMVGGSHTR